jgi:hypothetical protein
MIGPKIRLRVSKTWTRGNQESQMQREVKREREDGLTEG